MEIIFPIIAINVFHVGDNSLWLRRSITSNTAPNKWCELCLGIMIVSKKLTLNFGADLKFILLGGICGSILNGLFNSLAINQSFFTLEALYFIFGDVFGQIVLMLLFSQTVKFITSVK